MKKIILGFFTIGIILILAFIAVKGFQKKDTDSSSNTAKIERGDIARTVIATGKIEPLYKAEIKSKIGGLVKQFYVDEGRPG